MWQPSLQWWICEGSLLAQIGKDRTGLLAAMVLTCCGASVDEIVTDYARCATLMHRLN